MRVSFISFMFAALMLCISRPTTMAACDTCGCSFNVRRTQGQGSSGNMIITPTATTLGAGHASAGFLFEVQRVNSIPAEDAHALNDDEGHDVHGKSHEEYYNLSAGYGVLDNLDIFITAPIVSKTSIQIEDEGALGRKDTATGMGDLRVTGKYRFWTKGVDAALWVGVKAPTGATAKHNSSGEKFEPELQPGLGSWDLMTGVTASRGFADHLTVATSFQYVTRGEGAQEEKLGDVFHGNWGVSYALRPFGSHPNLSAVLELHNEWALRDHSRGQDRVWDSGGTTVLLSPGLSMEVTENISAFWAMPFPVYQNLGGQHEEVKYEIISGISWHF